MDHLHDEALASPDLDLAHLRRLWPFVRPYRAAFAGCLAMLVVSFALELAGPWLVRLAIDGPIADALAGRSAALEPILALGAGYLGVAIGGAALGYAYALTTAASGQRVIRDLRLHLVGHLFRLGPRFFDQNPSGRLVTRVTSDVENLNELISTGVLQASFDLLKIVGFVAVLFFLDVRLATYGIVVVPVLIAISLWFRRHARDSYREVRGRLARQNGYTAEAIGGVRTTRAFRRERAVQDRFDELNRSTQDGWRDTILWFALFFSVVDLALRWGQAGLLFVGGKGIATGTITTGVFAQFWLYFTKLGEPVREIGEKYNVLQSAFASSERIFGVLDQVPLPVERPDARPCPRRPATIAFHGVSFAYVPGTPVLTDVDLEVPAGTTCAIVGPTGAGKSTLLALVSRLHDPDRGRVLLAGVPLPEWELRSLRRNVAVVPQDVFLFSGSILDNVGLFDESISEARVLEALAAVGALEFVERRPGGVHAQVEERGATFSQGERQLLAMARALAGDPGVLILDEATANIDSESEARIQRALGTLFADRTSLVVAHRLSTVRNADQIVVVDGGRIVERGRHEELLARGALYAAMLASV